MLKCLSQALFIQTLRLDFNAQKKKKKETGKTKWGKKLEAIFWGSIFRVNVLKFCPRLFLNDFF